jgi:hypothetical protein
MRRLDHRWTRLLIGPAIASVALLGLTGTASAGTTGPTVDQTMGTTTISVDSFTDVSNNFYRNAGTLVSGQVTIRPRSVTGSGQIAGVHGGRLSISIHLFRLSTTANSAGAGWYSLFDPSVGAVYVCPVLPGGAIWDASTVNISEGCPGLLGWTYTPLYIGVNITETP